MSLWNRIREIGRNLSVAPRVKEPAKTSHSAPVMSEKPPIVDTLPPTVKAANEAINAATEPLSETHKFNPEAFYASLREGPLQHRATTQVQGTNAILAAMKGEPISWVAYALATAFHETGAKMLPNRENLNYSVAGLLNKFGRHRISRADAERLGRKPGEPALSQARQRAIANILYGGTWGRDNLGNTEPDDGWTYRGRGMDHCTGRANYRRTGAAIGVDLLGNPDGLLVLDNAVRSIVTGMKSGRYARDKDGRVHNFARHLPTSGEATAAAFGQARRIINGTDAAGAIASHALLFQRALRAGGW
jgi:predicted chitinase